jgi:hypothetical protein
MNEVPLPEPMDCPISWKYPECWGEKLKEEHGYSYLGEACGHSGADFAIIYFICQMGEMALTKVKTQNMFIKRLADGTSLAKNIRPDDIDWQSGHTWERLDEMWEALFEIHNAQLAPRHIQVVIQEVRDFMLLGRQHCEALFGHLAAEVEPKAPTISFEEYLQRSLEQIQESAPKNKWDIIDEKHSSVAEGFIYILENVLMPGMIKVGFTAGNPDKRAKEISSKYNLPAKFAVSAYWRTTDPYIIEQRIHVALTDYAQGGEFFKLDLIEAKTVIERVLADQMTER